MKAAQAKDRLTEAVDFALLQGLLKITPQGTLAHAPFALLPSPVDPALSARMVELTPLFNRLAYRVSRDPAFLEDALAPAARGDAFTARLLTMAKEGANAQQLYLAFDRSDYFIHLPHPGAPPELRGKRAREQGDAGGLHDAGSETLQKPGEDSDNQGTRRRRWRMRRR